MYNVLVLGGKGTLGHMVVRFLSRSKQLNVGYTSREHQSGYFYNVKNGIEELRQILEHYGPFDYLINCIGILSSQISEQDLKSVRRAILINALFPHDLAALVKETQTRVIHISTDGVFSGSSDEAYLEDAPHDCIDVYGKTKSLGEVYQQGVLTVRCSIIGPDPVGRKGLLEWFLSQPDGEAVIGYTNHLWNGVTTLQFAELCRKIILEDAFHRIWDESPVHHFCPNRPLSKYELIEVFRSVFSKNVTVEPNRSPSGASKRILATRYQSLPMLFGCNLSMEQAVHDLVAPEVIDHLTELRASKSPLNQ
jgi:dTDP-4-dehydrorhamnose reductase